MLFFFVWYELKIQLQEFHGLYKYTIPDRVNWSFSCSNLDV